MTTKLRNKFLCVLALVGLFVACDSKPHEKGLQQAENSLAAGDYAQALQQYQSIYQQNAKDPEIRAQAKFWIANIHYLYLDNVQEAIKVFEEFAHEYPHHPLALKAHWKIATTYREVFKDNRWAILKYQEVIDHFPDSPQAVEAQLAIAKCYAGIGDNQQAILEAEQVLETYPQSTQIPATLFFLADTKFLMEDYSKAGENYQKLIRNYPKDDLLTEAWMGLAMTQEELQEYAPALKSYQQIKDTYPNRELILRRIERLRETIKKEKKKNRRPW